MGGRLQRPCPWSKGGLTCLYEDGHGQLWVATYGACLFRFDSDGKMIQFTRQGIFTRPSFRSLHEDREGNLWVGTEGEV